MQGEKMKAEKKLSLLFRIFMRILSKSLFAPQAYFQYNNMEANKVMAKARGPGF